MGTLNPENIALRFEMVFKEIERTVKGKSNRTLTNLADIAKRTQIDSLAIFLSTEVNPKIVKPLTRGKYEFAGTDSWFAHSLLEMFSKQLAPVYIDFRRKRDVEAEARKLLRDGKPSTSNAIVEEKVQSEVIDPRKIIFTAAKIEDKPIMEARSIIFTKATPENGSVVK